MFPCVRVLTAGKKKVTPDVSVEQPIWSVWRSERKISFIFKENSVLPLLSSYVQKAIFFQTPTHD